jgi:hypothetical protein
MSGISKEISSKGSAGTTPLKTHHHDLVVELQLAGAGAVESDLEDTNSVG